MNLHCSDGSERRIIDNPLVTYEMNFSGDFEAATALLKMVLPKHDLLDSAQIYGIVHGILYLNSHIFRVIEGTGLWLDGDVLDPIPKNPEILEEEGTAASVLREKAKLILKEICNFEHLCDNAEAQVLVLKVIANKQA